MNSQSRFRNAGWDCSGPRRVCVNDDGCCEDADVYDQSWFAGTHLANLVLEAQRDCGASNKSARFLLMRGAIANWVVAMGAGLALIAAEGCRKQPVSGTGQPAALTLPWVKLGFAMGPLPVEEVDSVTARRVEHAAPPQQAEPVLV